IIHCAPSKTESAPDAHAASVCIVGMPRSFGSISGMNAPSCNCFVNWPALKFPTVPAWISAGSIFASSMAFLPASMIKCRMVLPSFFRLRLKSVRPPPRMKTSFINNTLANHRSLSSRSGGRPRRRRPNYLGHDGACPSISAAEGTDPRDVLADDQCVDVVRAFVRVNGLKVHEMPNDGIAICDADGAQYVARLARAFERHPNVVPLRQRNLRGECRPRLHHAGKTQREQLRLRNLLHHPDEFFLHQLETGNRATKLHSRFGVGERRFVTIDGRANHTPGNAHTRLRKTGQRRAQPRRLGQAVLRRYATVFEPAFRRAGHAKAELPVNILRAESGSILLHNESAHRPVVVLCPNDLHVGDGRVADPALAAVQDI